MTDLLSVALLAAFPFAMGTAVVAAILLRAVPGPARIGAGIALGGCTLAALHFANASGMRLEPLGLLGLAIGLPSVAAASVLRQGPGLLAGYLLVAVACIGPLFFIARSPPDAFSEPVFALILLGHIVLVAGGPVALLGTVLSSRIRASPTSP